MSTIIKLIGIDITIYCLHELSNTHLLEYGIASIVSLIATVWLDLSCKIDDLYYYDDMEE